MERFRVVYYDVDGKACEAVVEGYEGSEAAASIEDLGTLLSVESVPGGLSGPDA